MRKYDELTDQEKSDLRSEWLCDAFNAIERRDDGETVALRAIAILRVLAEGPVEEGTNPFPFELAC